MKKPLTLILLVISLTTVIFGTSVSQEIPDGPYFGQSTPGLTPEVFAPGIISVEDRFEYSISFSPDGKECSFGVTNSDWSWCDLYYTKQENGKWSRPVDAYFQNGYDGGYISPDGKYFFFNRREAWITKKQTDIYWIDSRMVFKPYVAALINNTYTILGSSFQFKIPAGTFSDYDDEKLDYSISSFNGGPLPSWLLFDSATLTLSGKSEEIGTVRLKITATDNIGSSISDEFSIFVLEDKARKPYLGETPPGMEPKLFAPDIVSIPGRLDRVIAFTPNGKELFFFNIRNRLGKCQDHAHERSQRQLD